MKLVLCSASTQNELFRTLLPSKPCGVRYGQSTTPLFPYLCKLWLQEGWGEQLEGRTVIGLQKESLTKLQNLDQTYERWINWHIGKRTKHICIVLQIKKLKEFSGISDQRLGPMRTLNKADTEFALGRGDSSRGAAGLQLSLKNERQKIPPNGQTRLKFGFSCEISQHNHFRHFRHHFGSTFPRNPTKPMFRSFPTTPLMRWRFQHNCRWIWRFRGCLRHSHKGKKPNNRLQET